MSLDRRMRRMTTLTGTASVLAGLLFLGAAVRAGEGVTEQYGYAYYKTQHGAPDGYPGCFEGTKEVTNKKTGETKLVPKYPQYGNPILENYPGSVEKYRRGSSGKPKYHAQVNPFNKHTLIRNVAAPGLSQPTEDYAEPIYYMPMYGNPVFTGKFRAPVKVVRLKRDGSNSIKLSFGALPSSMYAVRLISALDTEDRHWPNSRDPEKLIIRCTINSAVDGSTQTFTRRHRAVDDFYCTGEWYFHAIDDRAFTVEIRMDPESENDLLVHNVDLHNTLGGLSTELIKTQSTVYTTEARAISQDYWEKHGESNRDWGPNLRGIPRGKRDAGLWQGTPRTEAAQRARDNIFWPEGTLPDGNAQGAGQYGTYDKATLTKEEVEKFGQWEVPFNTAYGRNWDKERSLVNKKLGLTYTMDDYRVGKPLPDPFPYKDRGYGVYIEGRGYYAPIMHKLLRMRQGPGYKVTGHSTVGSLGVNYFLRNDMHAARDMAFLLCKMAYALPAQITQHKRNLQQVVSRPAQTFSFNDPVNRRQCGPKINVVRLAEVYDMLFDYIKDNEELAAAVGRRVPSIKTAEDLRRMLERRLLQWGMRQVMDYNVTNSHGTPGMAIKMATVAMDREATRPLMEWLFTRTYDYPLPYSGIADYMVTGTTREGTTTIGSFSYTSHGTPFLPVAASIDTYIRNGGDPKYNLADPAVYPKPFFAAYFNLDARVAGYWRLGVGDVGGLIRYTRDFDAQKRAVRIGWKYLKDPKLAWIIETFFGRASETDEEWAELEAAAATVTRNPWMANRSRALASWAGILEGGIHHDDHRFRRAVTVRTGVGWGHSHRDTLDLQFYAMGCQMTPDGGQRPGYGRPNCVNTHNHNLVVVDGGIWEGHAWTRMIADAPGNQMLHAKAVPPKNMSQVKLAERTASLHNISEGRHNTPFPSGETLHPDTKLPRDIVLPKSYVFDVYRVEGGQTHAYSFHGCAEDEFTINAADQRKVPLRAKAKKGDEDAAYLDDYVLEGYQGAGDAGEVVIATWRMAREGFTFQTKGVRTDEGKMKTYKCPKPEPLNLGVNYDPNAPRKYTRLHLLGQKGARLRWGRWVSAPYGGTHGQWFTKLHAVHEGEEGRIGVFPAIIEAYDGEPGVTGTKLLPVAGNTDDANRAVAVEVTTFNGHTDVLVDDGHEGTERSIATRNGKLTVTARHAYLSHDAEGLRQCSLSGGTEVDVDGLVAIRTDKAAYTGTIQKVNHLSRTLQLDAYPPAALVKGSFWDVGNDDHRTSCEVVALKKDGKGNAQGLRFRKGFELVRTRVKKADYETGVITGVLVSILMGAEEDNGMKPGMTGGLWATNDKMSQWWRCEYTGGSRDAGYHYKLTGAPVTEKDFPRGGEIRIYEMGPSDTAKLATFASIRRHPVNPDLFEVTANVACRIDLPTTLFPKGIEISQVKSWKSFEAEKKGKMLTLDLNEKVLGNGTVLLRAKQ